MIVMFQMRHCFLHPYFLSTLQVGSWSELISVVLPVLWYLGPYIAYRPSATVKLVRLISVFFDEKAADSELASSTHTDGGLLSLSRKECLVGFMEAFVVLIAKLNVIEVGCMNGSTFNRHSASKNTSDCG